MRCVRFDLFNLRFYAYRVEIGLIRQIFCELSQEAKGEGWGMMKVKLRHIYVGVTILNIYTIGG